MAYINGKWLDREERQERIDLLIESVRRLAASLKRKKPPITISICSGRTRPN